MTHSPVAYPRRQRGAAALAVSMVLLFAMTLIAFFANRGIIFEQKTAANQMRSTRAFESAEAGLEWAQAMLNDSRLINADCVATGGQPSSFRDKYTPAGSPTNLAPVANSRPGCRITAAGPVCNCPAGGATADFTTAAFNVTAPTDSNFTIELTDVPADPESVIVTAYGCVNQITPCTAANNAAGDATARVTVMLKLRPVIRAAPSAALTTGGWAQVCATFNITNATASANGYLVNSGGQTQIGNANTGPYISGTMPQSAPNCGGTNQTLSTTPGTPVAAAVVANDTSLSSIASSSETMFAAFFGTTMAQYQAAPTTYTVPGSTANARGTNLEAAYLLGWRSFWSPGDIHFSGGGSGGVLGSTTQPVMIASSSNITVNGSYDFYGIIYSDNASWNALGTGSSRVYGAVLARGDYHNNGNGTIVYDPTVLGNIRDTGVLVRVPGSWRDF